MPRPGPLGSYTPLISEAPDWVSRGARPRNPIAYDGNQGPTAGRSMPLCEYPQWPRYNGQGDPNSATSYTCVEDRRGR